MQYQISVIVPIYNVAQYLPRCLDSILENSHQDLEIICVNDGSTDESGTILEKYRQRDSRVTVITQENGGVSVARNTGLKHAGGTFVAFIDADDWVHPRYFETLLYWQKQHDADVVICDFQRTDGSVICSDRASETMQSSLVTRKQLEAKKPLRTYVWGRLYRRSVLAGIRFYPGTLCEDAIFNTEVLFCQELRVVHVHEALYYYYSRPGSLVTQITGTQKTTLMRAHYALAEKLTDRGSKSLVLREAIRHGLAGYYIHRAKGQRRAWREAAEGLRKCGRALLVLERSSMWTYILLSHIPEIYRLLRILEDPTLRTWEKGLKEQRTGKQAQTVTR